MDCECEKAVSIVDQVLFGFDFFLEHVYVLLYVAQTVFEITYFLAHFGLGSLNGLDSLVFFERDLKDNRKNYFPPK